MCTHRGGAAALGIPSVEATIAQIIAEADAEQAAYDAAQAARAAAAAARDVAPLSDEAQALIAQLQADRPDRIKYAMARPSTADFFRDKSDITLDLARSIGVSPGDISSWRIMSTPDGNGCVTAEATVTTTTRTPTSGRSIQTGEPQYRSRTATRYETARVRIIKTTAEE